MNMLKRNKTQFGGSKAMVAFLATAMITTLGFTSCTQEDEYLVTTQKTESQTELADDNNPDIDLDIQRNFEYDSFGTTSPDDFVPGFDHMEVVTRSGVSDFGQMLVNYVSNNYMDIIKSGASAALSSVSSHILHAKLDAMVAKLDEVNDKLDNVTTMLGDLSQKMDIQEYSAIYNKRISDYLALDMVNADYFKGYCKALAEGNTAKADSIVNQWAKKEVNNADADIATYQFLLMTPQANNSGQKSVTEVYDYWVFMTTPWEHMGYDKRDALRQGDIITGYMGYILAKAYYENDKLMDHDSALKSLNKAYEDFCKFYKGKEKVERHNDRLICQIKDANIVFKKNIKERDMFNHRWLPDNTKMISSSITDLMYGDISGSGKIHCKNVLRSSLTKNEAKVIYDYYNSSSLRKARKDAGQEEYLTFEQILDSVGFNLGNFESGKHHVMTLNDDCHEKGESMFNRNYFLYFDNVVVTNDKNPFKSNWEVGCMWIDSKHKTKSWVTYDIVKWWDHYTSSDSQYFYTQIVNRYKNMDPTNTVEVPIAGY